MRKLARVCFAFAAAIALSVYVGAGTWLLLAGLGCAAGAVCLWLRKESYGIALVLVGFALGCAYGTWYYTHDLAPLKRLAGQTQTVTVELRQTPEATQNGWRAVAKLQPGGDRVLFYGSAEYPLDQSLSLGDTLDCLARIQDSRLRYDQEDDYYQAKDISLILYQRGAARVTKAEEVPWDLLPAVLGERFKSALDALFPSQTAGLLRALLTGDRAGLSDLVKSDLSRSGISHVVAVSGMHVAILISILFFLTGKWRRLTSLIGCPVILCFMAVTGFSPSVVRAGIMQILLLLAPLLGRENDVPTALGFSLALILLENPWAIASISLQLSYSAVIGIYLFTGRLYRAMTGRTVKGRLLRALQNYIASTVAATFGATVFTTPLVAFYFGSISLMTLFTNLLVLPAVSGCFTFGLLAVLLGAVFPLGGRILAAPAELLGRYILAVIRLVARVPFAAVSTEHACILAWLIFSYGLFGLVLCKRGAKPKLAPVCCVALALICSLFAMMILSRRGNSSITALDVGQGQCIAARCGSFSALIDCGGSSAGGAGERAAQFLEQSGQLSLDVLMLSHYDLDHTGGLEHLLYRVDVRLLLLPDVPDAQGMREHIEQLAASYGTQVQYVTSDTIITFPGGSLSVFAPVSHASDNAASLCALFSAEGLDALVTGDLDIPGEYRLLSQKRLPQLDVLVAGHHGSATSTGQTLLEQTSPRAVLISVGYNSYGHPSGAVLQRIAGAGAAVYRTDQCGDITIWR